MNTLALYSSNIPGFLSDFTAAPELQRLKGVGMNCGCEYTSFPRFRSIGSYSRYEHSVGTALIVWNFTGNIEQTLSALFHDISTPVFAHVIDFLNGDYLVQESTEEKTQQMIRDSIFIGKALEKYGVCPDSVFDYHRYPVADAPSPRLCADRLEYTVGNMINYGFRSFEEAERMYSDLFLGRNEFGTEEICFHTPEIAMDFAEASLQCSEVYVSDEDRYSMQILSELLAEALSMNILCADDLYTTEAECVDRLCGEPETEKLWRDYCSLSAIHQGFSPSSRTVNAKKRYIDPYVENKGRVSRTSEQYSGKLGSFLERSFDAPIFGT